MDYSAKLRQSDLNMELPAFLLKMFVPAVVLSILVAAFMGIFFSQELAVVPVVGPFIPLIIAVVIPAFILLIPIYNASERGSKIETKLHLFITYLGALSTATQKRDEIMRRVMEKKEYGEVALETEKLTKIAITWRLGFGKAARWVAKMTPSNVFSEFLERLSFAFESGEDISEFLQREQSIVIMEYEEKNKSALRGLEEMKEVLVSLMTSLAFVGVFMLILPMLAAMPGTTLFIVLVIIFFVTEVTMLVYLRSFMPGDRLVALKAHTVSGDLLNFSLPIAIAGCVALGFLVFVLGIGSSLQLPVRIAIVTTPLILPGFVAGRNENHIRKRTRMFPALVRSIGTSMTTRGTNLVNAVYGIQHRDFGILNRDVKKLYRRLRMVKDPDAPWEKFFEETGSDMISKFGGIFLEAVRLGGSAQKAAEIVSENMMRVGNMMERRKEASASLRNTLYGISFGVIFSLYAGMMIVKMMTGMFEDVGDSVAQILPGFFEQSSNFQLSMGMLTMLILIHSLTSAIMIKVVDSGDYRNALFHFVILIWMSVMILPVVENLMGGIDLAPEEITSLLLGPLLGMV
jgi:flagellar protein FlaJ